MGDMGEALGEGPLCLEVDTEKAKHGCIFKDFKGDPQHLYFGLASWMKWKRGGQAYLVNIDDMLWNGIVSWDELFVFWTKHKFYFHDWDQVLANWINNGV